MSGQIVIEVGPNESAADLFRRRPDVFRMTVDGHLSVLPGVSYLTIVRCLNPKPAQLPWPMSAPLGEQILRRCIRRWLAGRILP